MEWSNQGIHGQMALNASLSAPSNLVGNSGRCWYFLLRKEPYGGMLIVTGQEPLSMDLSIFIQERVNSTLFPHLMKKFPLYKVWKSFTLFLYPFRYLFIFAYLILCTLENGERMMPEMSMRNFSELEEPQMILMLSL